VGSTAGAATGGDDAAKQAEFEEKVVLALGSLLISDVLADDLKSEAEQRELDAENETAG
jgi:hypothetical protein